MSGKRRVMESLALAVSFVVCAVGAYGEGSGTAELTYDAGLKAVTATKALTFGKALSVRGGTGVIAIGGRTVVVGAERRGSSTRFGLDLNGDGKVAGDEWRSLGRFRSGGFQFALDAGSGGSRKYALALNDISIYLVQGSGARMGARYWVNFSHKGTINGETIRIIDDDLDGTFTQNGGDGILIGKARAAVPLMRVHRIGEYFYRLDVAEDGSKIDYARLEDTDLGEVVAPIRTSALKCLVLKGSQSAFDLKADAKTTVLAGEYRLSYGLLAVGNATVPIKPTELALTYTIKAGQVNTIRIGAPLTLFFKASYGDGKISVMPDLRIIGAGGELYASDFQGTARPRVAFLAGNRVAASANMGYG